MPVAIATRVLAQLAATWRIVVGSRRQLSRELHDNARAISASRFTGLVALVGQGKIDAITGRN